MVRMKSEAEIEETAVQSRNKENKATHSLKLHFCTKADVTNFTVFVVDTKWSDGWYVGSKATVQRDLLHQSNGLTETS